MKSKIQTTPGVGRTTWRGPVHGAARPGNGQGDDRRVGSCPLRAWRSTLLWVGAAVGRLARPPPAHRWRVARRASRSPRLETQGGLVLLELPPRDRGGP